MTIFNNNGNLPEGMHDWSLTEVHDKLVTEFVTSITRPQISQGYSELVGTIGHLGLNVEQWLDGSFCTVRVDPKDLDLVTIVDRETLDSLSTAAQNTAGSLFQGPATKAEFLCDSYLAIQVSEGDPDYDVWQSTRNYWLKWFGRDREQNPKGIVRTTAGTDFPYPART